MRIGSRLCQVLWAQDVEDEVKNRQVEATSLLRIRSRSVKVSRIKSRSVEYEATTLLRIRPRVVEHKGQNLLVEGDGSETF